MSSFFTKIKEKGFRKSVRMISVKLKKKEIWSAKDLSQKKQGRIEEILQSDYDTVIIFENHFGYYNIMLQRPQHITRALSDERTLVLYNSYYDIDYHGSDRITRLKRNCYILDMFYYRKKILESLRGKNVKKLLMVYSTDTVPLSRIREYQEKDFYVIYEYVDDINPELISPGKLEMVMERHKYLLKDERVLCVATATKLYKNVLHEKPKASVTLISNGAECDKFPMDMETSDVEYLSWIREDSIKVGYYGAMASWIDYDLLKELARDRHLQIILIGIEHDESLKGSGILEYDNVRYFGKKPYEELAGYAHFWDVCIIPFLVNDITEATSPVKLFEYMSMGKPVVTTALPECRKYDIVNIAVDKNEFRKKIYEQAEKSLSEEYIDELRNCARSNDWRAKAKEIKECIKEVC